MAHTSISLYPTGKSVVLLTDINIELQCTKGIKIKKNVREGSVTNLYYSLSLYRRRPHPAVLPPRPAATAPACLLQSPLTTAIPARPSTPVRSRPPSLLAPLSYLPQSPRSLSDPRPRHPLRQILRSPWKATSSALDRRAWLSPCPPSSWSRAPACPRASDPYPGAPCPRPPCWHGEVERRGEPLPSWHGEPAPAPLSDRRDGRLERDRVNRPPIPDCPELPQVVDGRGGHPLPQRRHGVLRHRRARVEPHATHGGALPQEDEREAQQPEREQASPEQGRGPPSVVVRGASTPPRGGNDRPGGDCRGRDAGEEAAVVASSIGSGREACGINLTSVVPAFWVMFWSVCWKN
jgi:hypothetical protein